MTKKTGDTRIIKEEDSKDRKSTHPAEDPILTMVFDAAGSANKTSLYKREIRRKIYKRDRGQCHLCRTSIPWELSTLDHVLPLSRGGTWRESNLKIACEKCNGQKGNKVSY